MYFSDGSTYNNLVFGSWNFQIGKEKSCGILKDDLRSRLVDQVAKSEQRNEADSMETSDKVRLYSIRIVINAVIIALLLGAAVGIWYVYGNTPGWLAAVNCTMATNNSMTSLEDLVSSKWRWNTDWPNT